MSSIRCSALFIGVTEMTLDMTLKISVNVINALQRPIHRGFKGDDI